MQHKLPRRLVTGGELSQAKAHRLVLDDRLTH